MKPGPTTRKTVQELFLPGTQPTKSASITVTLDVDAASGLLWQDGCVGPMVARSFIDLSKAESGFSRGSGRTRPGRRGQPADRAWPAVPKHTRTSYFYGGGFYPYGLSWGGQFAPTRRCQLAPPPPTVCVLDARSAPCPSEPGITPDPSAPALPGNGNKPRQALTARDRGRGAPHSPTMVAPSPPSPRSPARKLRTSGWDAAWARTASRSAPVPRPWMIVTWSRPATDASSR